MLHRQQNAVMMEYTKVRGRAGGEREEEERGGKDEEGEERKGNGMVEGRGGRGRREMG